MRQYYGSGSLGSEVTYRAAVAAAALPYGRGDRRQYEESGSRGEHA